MPVHVKQGYAVNFCISHEANQALRDMTDGKRYGSFLTALILEERARREQRALARQRFGEHYLSNESLEMNV